MPRRRTDLKSRTRGSSSGVLPGAPPAPAAPANTALPTISGLAEVGGTLSCSTGTWLNGPTGFAFQWKRAGVAIAGATASTYDEVSADQTTLTTCSVTATNSVGSTTATSAAVGPVTAGGGGGGVDTSPVLINAATQGNAGGTANAVGVTDAAVEVGEILVILVGQGGGGSVTGCNEAATYGAVNTSINVTGTISARAFCINVTTRIPSGTTFTCPKSDASQGGWIEIWRLQSGLAFDRFVTSTTGSAAVDADDGHAPPLYVIGHATFNQNIGSFATPTGYTIGNTQGPGTFGANTIYRRIDDTAAHNSDWTGSTAVIAQVLVIVTAVPPGGGGTVVTNATSLLSAVNAAAAGDTIVLAPGTYAQALFSGKTFSPPITLEAQNPANKPIVQFNFSACSGFVLDGMDFEARATGGTDDYGCGGTCNNLTIKNSRARTVGDRAHILMAYANCNGLIIQDNEFDSGFTSVLLLTCQNVTLRRNNSHGFGEDNFKFSGCTNVLATLNWIHDANTLAGEHADAFQGFSSGGATQNIDIQITKNIVDCRTGSQIQCAFLADMAYVRALLQDNLFLRPANHGVMLTNSSDSSVERNKIYGLDTETVYGANITIAGADSNLLLKDNEAGGLVDTSTPTNRTTSGNTFGISKTAAQLATAVTTFRGLYPTIPS